MMSCMVTGPALMRAILNVLGMPRCLDAVQERPNRCDQSEACDDC